MSVSSTPLNGVASPRTEPGRCDRSAAAATFGAPPARSSRRSTTAAAPSFGEQSMWRWSGSHTRRDASTSSTVVGLRNIAFGFSSPLVRFFTTTWASCSLVTPDSRISRCARNAKYAGVAASPACSRQGSKNDDRMMPLGIFSIPNTSTVSYWPARIAPAASMSAAPPLAHPASTFTIGMPVRPSAPSTLWPAATPEYTVAQNAAWKLGVARVGERGAHRGHAHLGDGHVLEPAERVQPGAGDRHAAHVATCGDERVRRDGPGRRRRPLGGRARRAPSVHRHAELESRRVGLLDAGDHAQAVGELDDAEPERHVTQVARVAAPSPRSTPRACRGRRGATSSIASPPHAGHVEAIGNCSRPQAPHRPPRRYGLSCSSSAKRPSWTGGASTSDDAVLRERVDRGVVEPEQRSPGPRGCARRGAARRSARRRVRRRFGGTAPAGECARSPGRRRSRGRPAPRSGGRRRCRPRCTPSRPARRTRRTRSSISVARQRARPLGDDAVDLVAACRPVGQPSEARVVDEIRFGPSPCTGGRSSRPIPRRCRRTCRRRSGSCRAAPSSRAGCPRAQRTMPSCVVGRRASTRGCAARRRRARRRSRRRCPTAGVARVQRGRRGVRGEHAGEVVGDRHADAHGRPVGVAGEVQQPAVPDADAVEARAAARTGRPARSC